MATIKSITSSNAQFLLSIASLYDRPVPIQQFSADTAFTEESVVPAETVMGVDGYMSAGLVPRSTKQKISLEPDSDSVIVFDQWYEAQKATGEIYYANGIIDMPSLGKSYTLTKGVLTGYKHVPDAKKILQAQEYEITWESISTSQTV